MALKVGFRWDVRAEDLPVKKKGSTGQRGSTGQKVGAHEELSLGVIVEAS